MQALRVIDTADEPPSLALELPDGTTFGEWLAVGRKLRLGSQALNWHIGDWWKFGVSHWGEDETRKSALEIWGVEGETARVYGWVAEKFAPVNRLTDLTFTHYQRAASLPLEDAKRIIARAADEGLSVRDVQRAVQALKAANDPERSDDEQRSAVEAKPLPSQSARAELTVAYEMVIEFAEALEKERPLTKRERRLFASAQEFVAEAHAGHRPCPGDFDVIFVEQGRVECEAWYRSSRLTVNRWLLGRGKSRLVRLRADYVRLQRESGRPVPHDPDVDLPPIDQALHAVAKQAAHFLRVSRYGGWMVTSNDDGTWLVGTVRKSSDELIAMAERQGFDSIEASATLHGSAAEGVKP